MFVPNYRLIIPTLFYESFLSIAYFLAMAVNTLELRNVLLFSLITISWTPFLFFLDYFLFDINILGHSWGLAENDLFCFCSEWQFRDKIHSSKYVPWAHFS